MITRSNLYNFFGFNDVYMKQRVVIFKQILGHNLQDLCFHFEDEGIQPNLYLYEWFMSIFSKSLNLNLILRVWDMIIFEGIHTLYKTAIAILQLLEEELLESDFDEIMQILRNTQKSITDEDQFVELITQAKIPEWLAEEILILEKDQLPSETLSIV